MKALILLAMMLLTAPVMADEVDEAVERAATKVDHATACEQALLLSPALAAMPLDAPEYAKVKAKLMSLYDECERLQEEAIDAADR